MYSHCKKRWLPSTIFKSSAKYLCYDAVFKGLLTELAENSPLFYRKWWLLNVRSIISPSHKVGSIWLVFKACNITEPIHVAQPSSVPNFYFVVQSDCSNSDHYDSIPAFGKEDMGSIIDIACTTFFMCHWPEISCRVTVTNEGEKEVQSIPGSVLL